ncbi:class I SAM-dependent methyltransferase [Nocardia sp. NPDC057668]|uniref:class I SAM-dependent methyltransferase n=1 Tax=Nocardia sp. NPDC057668 TaxID=3346202 RepID=UPI00366AB200
MARKRVRERSPLEFLSDLLDPGRLPASVDDSAGYLDLLAAQGSAERSLAQVAMENPVLARIYEGLWRPMFTRAFSFGGPGTKRYTDRVLAELSPSGAGLVLDVACGPGLHTRAFAANLGADGLAVGLDVSVPMLTQAVRDSCAERVAFLRADAHAIPFADKTFDSVSCLAALYLIPAPHEVIEEMIRVLKPGGKLAIFTTVDEKLTRIPLVKPVLAAASGIHIFGRDEITARLRRAGFAEVNQFISGQGQFVIATR